MLRYRANFPAMPTGTDVVSQKLTVSHGETVETTEHGTDVTSAEFVVPDGVEVTLSLVYVDDANPPNESAPRTQTFTANDTIAPDAPGEFGAIELLGEE